MRRQNCRNLRARGPHIAQKPVLGPGRECPETFTRNPPKGANFPKRRNVGPEFGRKSGEMRVFPETLARWAQTSGSEAPAFSPDWRVLRCSSNPKSEWAAGVWASPMYLITMGEVVHLAKVSICGTGAPTRAMQCAPETRMVCPPGDLGGREQRRCLPVAVGADRITLSSEVSTCCMIEADPAVLRAAASAPPGTHATNCAGVGLGHGEVQEDLLSGCVELQVLPSGERELNYTKQEPAAEHDRASRVERSAGRQRLPLVVAVERDLLQ